MATTAEIQTAINLFLTDMGLLHTIVQGDVNDTVATEGGTVPSLNNLLTALGEVWPARPFNTLVNLNAWPSPSTLTIAAVIDDGVNNGLYRYDGLVWSKFADLPLVNQRGVWVTTADGTSTTAAFKAIMVAPEGPTQVSEGLMILWYPKAGLPEDNATLSIDGGITYYPIYRSDRSTTIKYGDLHTNELQLLCFTFVGTDRWNIVGQLSTVATLREDHDALVEEVSALTNGWAGVTAEVAAARDGAADLDTRLDTMQGVSTGLDARVDTAEDDIDTLDLRVDDTNGSWLGGYPGGAISKFTTGVTGAPGTGARIDRALTTISDVGPVVRWTGDVPSFTEFTHDDPQRLESGHVYEGRIVVQRRTNPVDPSGETIEFRVQYLSNAYASVSTVLVQQILNLLTTNNRQEYVVRIAAAAATGILAWPAGAVFARAVARIYGDDGVTDIEVLGNWKDVTSAVLGAPSPSLTTLQGQVSALESVNSGSRITALEGITTGATMYRAKTRAIAAAAAAAGSIPATVGTIEVLGTTLEGDDLLKVYKRSVSNPGSSDQFIGSDGNYWFYVAGGEATQLQVETGTDGDAILTTRRGLQLMNYHRPSFDTQAAAIAAIGAYAFTTLPSAVEVRRHSTGKPWVRSTWVREDTLPAEVLGTDVVTRGNMVTNAGPNSSVFWVLPAGVTISGGFMNATPSGAVDRVAQNKSLLMIAGDLNKVVFTVSSFVAGTVKPRIGSTDGTNVAANGTYTQYIIGSATPDVRFVFSATANLKIDNVSVQRVTRSHYFAAGTKWWRLREDIIHPAMLGAVCNGVADDATAFRDADTLALADNVKLLTTPMTVGSVVQINAPDFDIKGLTPLGSFTGESIALIEDANIISGISGRHYGYVNIVGTVPIASQLLTDTFIGLMIRNQNSTYGNIKVDAFRVPLGCVITGVSEEFIVECHASECMRQMVFREEVDRPIADDVTPGVMHVTLTGSVCHQNFLAETEATSGFGVDLYLNCENTVDDLLPAVQILTPRGEYKINGSLRAIYGIGIHINQKEVVAGVYDCSVIINNPKLMASSVEASPHPSMYVESVNTLSGGATTVVGFGGGLVIEEVTGVVNFDYTCYRLLYAAGLTIGSPSGLTTMGPGFIRYSVDKFDDSIAQALVIWPTVRVHSRDYLEVAMACSKSNATVNIHDLNTGLRRINGHINWMGDGAAQETVLLTVESLIPQRGVTFSRTIPAGTTMDLTVPANAIGVSAGKIHIREQHGIQRASGYYLLGTATGNQCTKDFGSSDVDFSFGSGTLASVTANHIGVKARSDAQKLSIRNGFAVDKTIIVELNQ